MGKAFQFGTGSAVTEGDRPQVAVVEVPPVLRFPADSKPLSRTSLSRLKAPFSLHRRFGVGLAFESPMADAAHPCARVAEPIRKTKRKGNRQNES